MNPDDLKQMLDALKAADVREFSLQTGSFSLDLKRGPQAGGGGTFAPSAPQAQPTFETAFDSAPTAPASTSAPASEATPAAPAASAPAALAAASGAPVKAPIVGTFYASSSPDAAPYVKVGDTVTAGQILCIIEAMKLMNEIEAEAGGVVREILVKNAEPVEYGQTLFLIE
ncbi:acetyl-CoA carboxylase biotin carboxyl carrier protein [Deinococcus sp. AJ005]|uniref:acetyl-CoA carboxylase biotin carboxyl carrier protein n=1 Tax=Deinococcus sp. AJ005 TaxID=2652443 RepID=UPI00125CD056|nr:acetyl-CoA carboxylase biotin carboxyl carrier protein [Deinococcus sp. AJ005]QFP76024.1 acetyl-CoA carboxylase biotin carboxyl carrier protein [Deinococcus sp. AJ005]